jgi:hypothetical protein
MDRLRTINPEQMGAIIRTLFQMAGAAIGMFGFLTDEDWLALSGPAASFLILLWGVWARSDTNLLVSAANVPGTKAVIVEPETASAIPNDKVASAASYGVSSGSNFA